NLRHGLQINHLLLRTRRLWRAGFPTGKRWLVAGAREHMFPGAPDEPVDENRAKCAVFVTKSPHPPQGLWTRAATPLLFRLELLGLFGLGRRLLGLGLRLRDRRRRLRLDLSSRLFLL